MKRSRRATPKGFATFRRSLQTQKPLPRAVWIVIGVLLVLLLIVVVSSVRRHDALISWREDLEARAPGLDWPTWNPAWPSLSRPGTATVGDLRGAYAYAALNADRLRFIPCYCGCARDGHHSALDCFVSSFTPQGMPIWTDHAFTCPLCVNILREVSLMTSRGMSLPAIREAIDEHHESMFATATPTPLPR
jgi:hypothetical protein